METTSAAKGSGANVFVVILLVIVAGLFALPMICKASGEVARTTIHTAPQAAAKDYSRMAETVESALESVSYKPDLSFKARVVTGMRLCPKLYPTIS